MDAVLRERRVLPIVATMALGVAVTLLYALGIIRPDWYSIPFISSTLVSLLYAQVRGNMLPRKRNASVRADAAGLHADGALLVPRQRIAQAHFTESSRKLRLVNRFGFSILDLNVGREGAQALLVGLELDAAHAAATFSLEPTSALRWGKVSAVAGLASLFLLASYLGAPVYGPLLPIAVLVYLIKDLPVGRGQARIAPDGVALTGLRQKRFVSFDRVRAVRLVGTKAVLELVAGPDVLLEPAEDTADAVVTRIEEALLAWRAGGDSRNTEALLARSGRSVTAWATALRCLTEDAVGYRSAAVSDDALWTILEDPKASAVARGAAAFTLRSRADTDPQRLARVKNGIAAPRLRVAVEKIAGAAEDEGREEALALLDEVDVVPEPPRAKAVR